MPLRGRDTLCGHGRDDAHLLQHAKYIKVHPDFSNLAVFEPEDCDSCDRRLAARRRDAINGPRWVPCEENRQTTLSPSAIRSSIVNFRSGSAVRKAITYCF